MKLFVILMLAAAVAAAPSAETKQKIQLDLPVLEPADDTPEGRNILVNLLIRQLIAILRNIINNGSSLLGIPPLDPIQMDEFHIYLPAGLINVDLKLQDVLGSGFGGFVVHRSNTNLRDITLDLEISVPRIDISSEVYDLIGDLFTAIPIYGHGRANFVIEGFRLKALLYLKQSDDERSIIIDRVENASFEIPSFKCDLTGAIGGGDIDAIVNAVVEEVIIDYINRFQGIIATIAGHAIVRVLNPVLEQFDSWIFIAPFV